MGRALKQAFPMILPSRSQQILCASLLIVIATFWAFHGILNNGFISYDDVKYLIENDQIAAGLTVQGLRWAMTSTYDANWFPLTWFSHMADISMFGLNPRGHHLVNLLLHTANALLLFRIFTRLNGPVVRSACVALLFALHPLHVESVAWAAERKDVLSTLFFMLTISAYITYTIKRTASRYCFALLLYILGLASKPMLVSVPLVLLLLDAWPLGRFRNKSQRSETDATATARQLFVEKIPFFILSAASCIATYTVQSTGVGPSSTAVSPLSGSTFSHAMVNYVQYLYKSFWPVDLAILYPYSEGLALWQIAGSIVLLSLITLWSCYQWNQKPYLFIGWAWFLVTIAPVVGFVRIGVHSIADRYTYIPLIGIAIMVVWTVADVLQKRSWGNIAATVTILVTFTCLGATTLRQTRYWKDSTALFEHTLSVTDNNWAIHNNLAAVQLNNNQKQEALKHLRESLRILPTNPVTHSNLGSYFNSIGDLDNAIRAFQIAIELNPSFADAYYHLSIAQLAAGNRNAAYETYLTLAEINPALAESLKNYIYLVSQPGKSP
jgi:hypothetical protein